MASENNEKKSNDTIWILVPLAALSIPIFAVIGDNTALTVAVGVVLAIVAIVIGARSLMTHRHELTMRELEARERIVRAEKEQLTEAQRIIDRDTNIPDLRSAIENDPQT